MTVDNRGLTPSQTVGPFFLACLLRDDAVRQTLPASGTDGERIRIEGRVLDGDGKGVPDAVVEIWQADSAGRYAGDAGAGFIGFGRAGTDERGEFWFETVKPGATDLEVAGDRRQAPHISVAIFARGLLNHLYTRLYFAGEPANETDAVLACVPPARRGTVLAEPMSAAEPRTYRWDIVLQGDGETAFFNL